MVTNRKPKAQAVALENRDEERQSSRRSREKAPKSKTSQAVSWLISSSIEYFVMFFPLGMLYRAHEIKLEPVFGTIPLLEGPYASLCRMLIAAVIVWLLRIFKNDSHLSPGRERAEILQGLFRSYSPLVYYWPLMFVPALYISKLGPAAGLVLMNLLVFVPIVMERCSVCESGVIFFAFLMFNLGYSSMGLSLGPLTGLVFLMVLFYYSITAAFAKDTQDLCQMMPFIMSVMGIAGACLMVLNGYYSLGPSSASFPITDARGMYQTTKRHASGLGYVSVIEGHFNDGLKARWLRNDHSLLGGQWTNTENELPVPEPMFGVFTMMEAVRLVERQPGLPATTPERALNLGMGIGTTANALVHHGVAVTVVELNPIIFRIAREDFLFPGPGGNKTSPGSLVKPVFKDALLYVKQAQNQRSEIGSYDYVIHDLFSGGGIPYALYTIEYLTSLRALMKDDSVLALNYVGDLDIEPTIIILRTVLSAFDGQCRAFREVPAPESHSEATSDPGNQVIFCRKTPAGQKADLVFRAPRIEDFLGSGIRQEWLVPKHEVDLTLLRSEIKTGAPDTIEVLRADDLAPFPANRNLRGLLWVLKLFLPMGTADLFTVCGPFGYLTDGLPFVDRASRRRRRMLQRARYRNAVSHWWAMRQLLPAGVWVWY